MAEVKKGDTIAVWFSSGAASAVTAHETIKKYGDICNIRIINNPVKEEHDDNLRFKDDVENWLDHSIESAINENYPTCSAVDVWEKRNFMSGPKGAPCTLELKKKARQQWEDRNEVDHHVLGFTSDEVSRAERIMKHELPELLPVAIEENISKQQCFDFLANSGIKKPEIYKLGFPNANCIGCVKATSPTYWNLVRKHFPDVFYHRADQSRNIGAKLVRVNNERIYLDKLSKNAKGRPMKNYHIECGIFCEES